MQIAEYTLLKSERGYNAFVKAQLVDYPEPPRSYPCFVRRDFRSDENTVCRYLYPDDVRRMNTALEAALRPKPERKV